ncbi:MAG: LysR family transcriptional regulator [Ignavibacteriae bacterium]|nr:hydrogen peroxide-inducible genes activator [Ignavibacteriota bacterium]NOG99522.1 LysR family transcriptional regulator [Ignavibacteriota bacterium]
MTLVQLNYIVALDTYKNFEKAAEQCFITQPTLSMQIQKLEEELGILIFDRSRKPVKTTEIGAKIVDQARVILNETDRISEIINIESNEVKGILRLGIIPTIAPYLLPLFLVNFVDKFPNVNLIIDEIQTHEILNKLKSDELDAAILVTPLDKSDIIEDPLFYEPFVAYISEKHRLFEKEKIKSADLMLKDLWLLKEGHCFRDHIIQICDRYSKNEIPPETNISFEAGTIDTLMKLVEHNFGMTLVPYLLALEVRQTKKRKYLRDIEKPTPKREVSLIFKRAFVKRHLINLLKEEIIDSLPEELKNKRRGFVVG